MMLNSINTSQAKLILVKSVNRKQHKKTTMIMYYGHPKNLNKQILKQFNFHNRE